MDYYQTLGIDKNATAEEVKKAYRKLAHQYHPDKKGGDEKKFKELNQAYQVLGNKEKREQYDKFGHAFGQGQGQGGFDFSSFQRDGFNFSDFAGGVNLDDILENLAGFGFSRRSRERNLNRGRNIELAFQITLEEAAKGFKEKVVLDKAVECQRCSGAGAEPDSKVKECPSCRGKGWVEQVKRTFLGTFTQQAVCPECQGEGRIPEKPCNVCKGQGRVQGEQEIEINIPAGVDSGQTVKLTGQGEPGFRGAKAGDLILRVQIKPHKVFKRRGDDLYLSRDIPFSLAALGGEVEVPALLGKKLSLKVPSGTSSGRIFRLAGQGIPHFRGFGAGALYVELNVDSPKKLTRKQKKLLEQLQAEGL